MKNKNNTLSVDMISNNTKITGDIDITGDFRIDGILNGNVKCSGKLIVGATSIINGDIECKIAEISGSIHGNIKSKENLTFKSTSSLDGNITTTKLIVESGAVLIMNCNMNDKTI